MKRIVALFALVAILMFGCAPKISQEDYDAVVAEKTKYQSQLTALQSSYDSLQAENDALVASVASVTAERDGLQVKVDSASEWFELTEEEQADMLIVLEERADARAAEAAKEAQVGYETGITYEQLARTPDDYTGKKVKFTGIAIQVIEGSGTTMLRVATSGRYDNVILVQYNSDLVSTRVLEDDKITIYGISEGLYTYESTGGGDITIPFISVDQIAFAG